MMNRRWCGASATGNARARDAASSLGSVNIDV
jgi:hypothetical protein